MKNLTIFKPAMADVHHIYPQFNIGYLYIPELKMTI